MAKKAFITGINGFTGSVMDKFLSGKGLSCAGIVKKQKNNGSRFWEFDLAQGRWSDLETRLRIFNPDFVFHFASPLVRTQTIGQKVLCQNLAVDYIGTLKLLEIINKFKKKPKIIVSGTNAVYAQSKNPLTEDDPLWPQEPYGIAKFAQERACLAFARYYRLPLVATRTFHLIGPGQKPSFVVSNFCRQIAKMEGKKLPVLKAGNLGSQRDFTDVRDAASAYWQLAKNGKNGEVYNICSQKTYSIGQILENLASLTNIKFKVVTATDRIRKNEIDKIVGCNKKISNLGWTPTVSLEKSLRDTLAYSRQVLNTS